MNKKKQSLIKVIIVTCIIVFVAIYGFMIEDIYITSNFNNVNQSPSWQHLFGTDHLGRDVFLRTIKGLSTSLTIGIFASFFSAIIALFVGVVAGIAPKWVDQTLGFIIDFVLSIPHLILLIIISFSLGRGLEGVTIGLIVSHWTGLSRIIRAEVLSLKEENYIKISKQFGKSNWYIIFNHILPHVKGQFIIGIILLFPHAILHEASITFLGFGLPPEMPAIGVMLSESMSYIQTGTYWLLFPGICLVILVLLFDSLGKNIKRMLSNDDYLGVR